MFVGIFRAVFCNFSTGHSSFAALNTPIRCSSTSPSSKYTVRETSFRDARGMRSQRHSFTRASSRPSRALSTGPVLHDLYQSTRRCVRCNTVRVPLASRHFPSSVVSVPDASSPCVTGACHCLNQRHRRA